MPPQRLKKMQADLAVSPCGVAFVAPQVRRGILPQMLEEILEARLAVKDSMKRHRDDRTLQRVLHARQLGLKLIANVTYGYTSANFSGRMPCIEVGTTTKVGHLDVLSLFLYFLKLFGKPILQNRRFLGADRSIRNVTDQESQEKVSEKISRSGKPEKVRKNGKKKFAVKVLKPSLGYNQGSAPANTVEFSNAYRGLVRGPQEKCSNSVRKSQEKERKN